VGSKPEFEASYHNWKRVSMKLASTRELADSLASLAAACNDPGRRIKGEADQYQGTVCLHDPGRRIKGEATQYRYQGAGCLL
jgi:hypothetical protein